MSHLAKVAGLAVSTISKGLRDDPTIPANRCAEIKQLARRLGYRPHPMVSALMAQLHHRRRRNDPYHIAWLDFWPAANGSPAPPILQAFKPMLQGALDRAQQLGYEIEVHRVGDGLRAERLRQILVARGQWGLIIPPVPESCMRLPFDLHGISGVTIGTSLKLPVMHRVSPNHFQGAQLASRRLREKGARRIGLALSPAYAERMERKWIGGYVAEQAYWPEAEHIPPFLNGDSRGEDEFGEWLRAGKPDAILLAEPHIFQWLRRPGPKARDSAPIAAWLEVDERCQTRNYCGVDYRFVRVGAAAVELLVGQINRNERGSPAVPETLQVDAAWVEG